MGIMAFHIFQVENKLLVHIPHIQCASKLTDMQDIDPLSGSRNITFLLDLSIVLINKLLKFTKEKK